MTNRRVAFLCIHLETIGTLALAAFVHARRHDYSVTGTSRFSWAVAYLVILMLASYAAGLPDSTERRSAFLTALSASGVSALAMSGLQLVTSSELLPRFVIFATATIVVVLWTMTTHIYQRGPGAAAVTDRVVFVGSDPEQIERDVTTAPERRAVLVSCVEPNDVVARAGSEPLVDLANEGSATVLVLGKRAQDDPSVMQQAAALHESGVRVRSITSFYAEWLGKLPAFELQRVSMMFDISEVHGRGYVRFKRMLDILAGLVAALAFVALVPFVLVGNLLGNRGALLYRQDRVGRGGRKFQIVKFRTMRVTDDATWTTRDDPRVTPFGRVLRRTHLDEIPQFVNILRGDLSIVGPRPEQPRYVESLVECIPFYGMRHLVRPGLTGWAQVKYGYAASPEDAMEKLQYDFYYLQHQSLAFDIRIIARTMRTFIGGRGR